MRRLVLIGGAPGVGKTTLLHHLPDHFDACACLDADDLWRVDPPRLAGVHAARRALPIQDDGAL